MPMILLKIGMEEILLPDDKGVSTVLKALSRGVLVSDYLFKGEVRVQERDLEVGMKLVPKTAKIVGRERPLTPEEKGYVKIPPKRIGQGVLMLEDQSS